jgi:gliding motility-associated-like protein
MKSRIYIIFFIVSILCGKQFMLAQNISGTVNLYTNVTGLAANVVTVGSSAGFLAGDKVLLIQMKGATITTGNVVGFGNITAYGNAGNYEFLTVASIAGNNITLTTNPCLSYTTTGAVQLIRVPVYTNPNITGTITCPAWNGATGGVVAFEATGTVTFNANINVAGLGFRGGLFASGGFSCNDPNYANGTTGKKGEGIATAPVGQDGNRRPLANGGGGSNTGNPGAGGGGNYGAGGRGGVDWSGCGTTTSYGIGGLALTTVTTKAFLGGGGGGGFRDNGLNATSGMNGGGIVFIKANQITGNGFSILANGIDQTVNTDSEGAGAGGGGGSVHLWAPTYTSTLNINVKGGNGGSINNTLWNGYCHGPGGGGGGGYVWFSNAATPGGVAVNSLGGNPGIVINSGPCIGTPNQATAGQNGAALFNLPVPTPPLPLAHLGNDTTICTGQNLTLQTDTTYASYLWSNGATTPTITVNTTGTYWVEVPIGCGTVDRDSIVVTVGTASVNIGADQSICQGDSAQFNAGAGFASYVWSTGDTVSNIYTTTVGAYIITVTDAVGCVASDTASLLNVYTLPIVNLGPDTSLCGGSIVLDAGPGFVNYLWQNGSSASTYNVTTTGTYWAVVTDANTCIGYDSVLVTINPVPAPNLGPDVSFCIGASATLNPGVFAGYVWNNLAVTPTLQVTSTGTYYVTVTNAAGCTATDTLVVQNVYPLPAPNLGSDQTFCDGNSITLNPGSFANYEWQNAATTSTFPVTTSGNYFVSVTDINGCENADTVSITVFPLPVFSLGVDLDICPGDNLEIFPSGISGPVSYLWNDQSTDASLIIYDAGVFYLTVTDGNICDYTDTVHVNIVCPPTIYVPNAFTPNLDEINPIFRAYGTNVKEFQMDIYDRWGRLIYTINELNEGWDGTLNGNLAPIGQYVYKITYQNYLKVDDVYIMGGFNLIR